MACRCVLTENSSCGAGEALHVQVVVRRDAQAVAVEVRRVAWVGARQFAWEEGHQIAWVDGHRVE